MNCRKFIAFFSLLILIPFLFFVCLLILSFDGYPFLFVQDRVGRSGRIFRIYKFRTMSSFSSSSGDLVTSSLDSRVTRLGSFLRRFKVDELPQLFNVLNGSMRFVGPRPEVPRYYTFYSAEYKTMYESTLPGITSPSTLLLLDEEALLSSIQTEYGLSATDAYTAHLIPLKEKLSLSHDFEPQGSISLVFRTIFRILCRR